MPTLQHINPPASVATRFSNPEKVSRTIPMSRSEVSELTGKLHTQLEAV